MDNKIILYHDITLYISISETYIGLFRIPTSSGNHGQPGKSLKKVPCMEKSWNLKKTLNNHGEILEFCEII